MKTIRRLIIIMIAILLLIAPIGNVCAAQSIKISQKNLSLNIGQTRKLYITGTTDTITWKSSNKSIATISNKGSIKAISEGSVTITATVNK